MYLKQLWELKYQKIMKKILYKILPYVFWFIMLSWIITAPIISDDPPKKKKVLERDTTRINIKQMRQLNSSTERQIRMLDSIIMQIDTLKKKK